MSHVLLFLQSVTFTLGATAGSTIGCRGEAGFMEPAAFYIYSCTVSMLSSHMLYCIAAYAASTATMCPSGKEICDLHDYLRISRYGWQKREEEEETNGKKGEKEME